MQVLSPNYVTKVNGLKKERQYHKYTQEQLSVELEKSKSFIERIENFHLIIEIERIDLLYKYLETEDKEALLLKVGDKKRCKRCWIVLKNDCCKNKACQQKHGESPNGIHCTDCYVRFVDKNSDEYECGMPQEATQAP